MKHIRFVIVVPKYLNFATFSKNVYLTFLIIQGTSESAYYSPWDFIIINCAVMMKLVIYCDSLMNSYSHLVNLLSLFWKNRLGLSDHVAVSMCVCVCLCIFPIVARQRIGKNPHIIARQRLGRNVTAVTNTHTIGELLDASFSMWPVSY
jgi:hypothetical protein